MQLFSESTQLEAELLERGIDVSEKTIGGGGLTGRAMTIVPGEVSPFAIYNTDAIDNDKADWSGRTGIQGAFRTDKATLIGAHMIKRVEGGEKNATDPNARILNVLEATVVFGPDTVLGVLGEDNTVTPHSFWDNVKGSFRVELSVTTTPDICSEFEKVLRSKGFVDGAGPNLVKGGQELGFALEAPNGGGNGAYAQKIENGLELLGLRIAASKGGRQNSSEFTSRDFLTNFERSYVRYMKALAAKQESDADHMGVLSGTTWGPNFYTNGKSPEGRACYSAKSLLISATVSDRMGNPVVVEFTSPTRAQ